MVGTKSTMIDEAIKPSLSQPQDLAQGGYDEYPIAVSMTADSGRPAIKQLKERSLGVGSGEMLTGSGIEQKLIFDHNAHHYEPSCRRPVHDETR